MIGFCTMTCGCDRCSRSFFAFLSGCPRSRPPSCRLFFTSDIEKGIPPCTTTSTTRRRSPPRLRAQWLLDDVLREDQDLDFSRNMMPESLARTAALTSLDAVRAAHPQSDQRAPISRIFGIVEEFILPFLLDHARPQLRDDDWRVRALLNFAGEEAKHIHLFKRFHAGVRSRLPGRVPDDRPVRSDRRRDPAPRPARGRARHPDDRVDDPAALPRLDPRRRRSRSAVQEPDEASLDGGGAARQARHPDRRSAGRRPQRRADRPRDRRILRDRRVSSTTASSSRPSSTSTRSKRRSGASSRTATRSSPSSTRRRAGPTSVPAWSTSASRPRSRRSRPAPRERIAEAAPLFA